MMQGGHGDDLSRTNESGLQDHRPHGDLYGLYGRVRPLRRVQITVLFIRFYIFLNKNKYFFFIYS